MAMRAFLLSRNSSAASLVRYLAVGAVVYFIDLASFMLLYGAAGAGPQFANISGKIAGAGAGFLLHKYVTYLDRQAGAMPGQAAKYLLLLGFNLLLSISLVFVFIDLLDLPVVAFRIVADVIVIACSYVGMRMLVFRTRGSKDRS